MILKKIAEVSQLISFKVQKKAFKQTMKSIFLTYQLKLLCLHLWLLRFALRTNSLSFAEHVKQQEEVWENESDVERRDNKEMEKNQKKTILFII